MLNLTKSTNLRWCQDWLCDYYEYSGNENVKAHRGMRTTTPKCTEWYTQQPIEYESYDLVNDPGEEKNLHDDPAYAEVPNHLKQRFSPLLVEAQFKIPERE